MADEIIDQIKQMFDRHFRAIDEKLSLLEKRLSSIEEKLGKKIDKKRKYVLIKDWRENIQNNCKYKVKVSVEEEAEYFCRLINDVCNMINCPLNYENPDNTNIPDSNLMKNDASASTLTGINKFSNYVENSKVSSYEKHEDFDDEINDSDFENDPDFDDEDNSD